MSTKTTFKRIALVAVAALGLGVMSVAPSQATISGLAISGVTAGTAGNSSETTGTYNYTDSTTAAKFTISGYLGLSDSLTVTLVTKSIPVGGVSTAKFLNFDSVTPTNTDYLVYKDATTNAFPIQSGTSTPQGVADTATAFTIGAKVATNINHTFGVQLESTTGSRVAGTYTFTVVVQGKDLTGSTALQQLVQDVTIVVPKTTAAASAAVTTVDPSKSTAYMSLGAAFVAGTTSDSSVALVSTASAADQAVIRVVTKNATGTGVNESITATVTGAGVIGLAGGTTYGKSITVAGTGSTDLGIRADGTTGVGSIVIKTSTVTFAAKSVTFFAKAAKTITLAVNKPVISVSTNLDTIRATATDADGNVWGGQAYIVAATAADALIAGSSTPVACTFNSAKGYHECPVAGTATGTANFNVIDASTVALATATSAAAAVRVSTGVATTAKISFDKASYAPGEKATVLVTVLDSAGLALPASTITGAFTAAPTVNVAFGASSDSFGADVTLAAATSSTSKTTAGSQQYTVYMPLFAGNITITATGSTGLAASGRVAISATASVVNSSVDAATDAANEATDAANAATDAALAAADAADAATAAAQDASDAVAALSATVATLVASLKAQITSLTNLVIKIQKKVKA